MAWYRTAETKVSKDKSIPTRAASDSVAASPSVPASDNWPASHGGAASQRIEPVRVRIQMQERLHMFHARCTVHVMVV